MRRFRLLTDGEYVGCVKDQVFYECEKISDTGRTVKYYQEMYPEDWQEVFEEPQVFNRVGFNEKPLHKDTDLGHFAGLAMQGYISAGSNGMPDPDMIAQYAMEAAKQLIKQLDKESANNLPTNHNE